MPEIAGRPENRIAQFVPIGVFDRLDYTLFALDKEWRITFANSAAERFLGHWNGELLGHVLWEEVPAFGGGRFENECRRAMREQKPREFEEFDQVGDAWLEVHLYPSGEGLTVQICDITSRKREELAQADRARWYSTLVNSVGGIVWVADAETFHFSFVSQQAEKVLGYPVDQWLKDPNFWHNHVHPDDREWSTAFCMDAMAKGRDHDFEYRMIAADGRVVWLRDIVSVKVEDGVTRLRGIMLDITDQKLAEERLQRKEEHFRKLVENAWDSFGMVAPDGTILYVSPTIERMLGFKPEELIGTHGYDWVHPDDVEAVRTLLEKVFAGDQTDLRLEEYRSRHKNGSWRTLELVGQRIIDEHGRVVGIFNVRDITERSRAERRLRESEARFRTLFERNAAGMAISDLDGYFLQVNPAFCRMLGYSVHELLQKEVREVTHPDDWPEAQRGMDEVKRGKRSLLDFEKRYIHKNGSTVWGHVTAIYVSSEDRPIYCVATIQDITERKLAAEALRISEERYRSLIQASTQVVWITDATGAAVPGQPTWRTLTGQSEEQVLGWGWLDAVHPDDRSRVERVWRNTLREKECYQTEFRIRTAAGRYRDFAVRGAPVYTLDGSVREWVGTCADITDQKRAAAHVLRWKNRYEAAIAASGQLLYEYDLSNGEVTYGGNLFGMLGFSNSEMTGGFPRWVELIHPDDRDRFKRETDRAHRSHEPLQVEYRVRHKDGTYIVVNDEGRFYRYVDGTAGCMIGFVSDITEHKNTLLQLAAAKEDAEAASRAKDDFLAALSHELRTPLNPVLILTSELERSDELAPSVRQDFAMIRKNVELEARIIDDLLDLTRITHGKLQMRARPADAHTLIRHAVEVVRPELDAKQLVLAVELSADDHTVSGDPVRLQQVFWNVLKNAVKFTPPGGTITVRSRNTDGQKLLVQISDTGIGISEEDLPRVFEAFVQGGGVGTHLFGGLGLGLTISKRIIDLHHGRIWAESAGRGAGSTFSIELPLTTGKPVEAAPISTDGAKVAPSTTGSRILLVEDHDPTRETLTRLLIRQGYRVSSADTVAAARALAESNQFDLVVSDIGLPDGNGQELMVELHQKYGLTGVALSGYGMEDDIKRSLASGFAVHLTKPVDMQALRRAITDVEKHAHPAV
ncbi:PAS domain S-box protein [Verrucomicrobiota bacterium sgz303538]